MRYCTLVTACFACLHLGAESTPKPKPTDYPAHAQMEALALGAEYMVRSFSGGGRAFAVQDYLVVEVALYPIPGGRISVSHSQFTLRLNGKKQVLPPAPPPFVAAALKHPDYEFRPAVIAGAGVGDAAVILGRPQTSQRFPDDRRPQQGRLPSPPQAPAPDDPSGVDREAPVRAEEVAVNEALPEGECVKATRGYLYFYFKGKTKSIKTVELLYSGPAGSATLPLR